MIISLRCGAVQFTPNYRPERPKYFAVNHKLQLFIFLLSYMFQLLERLVTSWDTRDSSLGKACLWCARPVPVMGFSALTALINIQR